MRQRWPTRLADLAGRIFDIRTAALSVRSGRAIVPGTDPSGTPEQHGLYRANVVKGWGYVTYSAGAPTLKSSYGISSVSDGGDGILGVKFSRAFTSASGYAIVGTASPNRNVGLATAVHTASGCRLQFRDETGALADPAHVCFIMVGNQ